MEVTSSPMSFPLPLTVRDASPTDSIWRDFGERTFRENVAALQKVSDGKPGDPKVYSQDDWQARVQRGTGDIYVLPLDVEQRIADDLAFMTAIKGEAKTVTAAALEEKPGSEGLTVRIATNNGVNRHTMDGLKAIFQVVEQCASRALSQARCTDQIFNLVIELNRECLHARFQSKHWKVPKRKGRPNASADQRVPLEGTIQRFIQRSSTTNGFNELFRFLNNICSCLKRVDDYSPDSEEGMQSLKDAVKQSYELCTPGGRSIEETLTTYGLKPSKALEDSTIKQINKIGRYWGFCEDLAKAARRYGNVFKSISLQIVPPYQPYEPDPPLTRDGKVTYYVHAEIQLLSFYDLTSDLGSNKPRVLGVSKAACYLCNLFILKHRQYHITKTHGKLYHQWNFPDLKKYNGRQRKEYRRILVGMNTDICKTLRVERKTKSRRPDLMESYIHLPPKFLPSAPVSDAGTIISQSRPPSLVQSSQRLPQAPPAPVHQNALRTEARSANTTGLFPETDPLISLQPPTNNTIDYTTTSPPQNGGGLDKSPSAPAPSADSSPLVHTPSPLQTPHRPHSALPTPFTTSLTSTSTNQLPPTAPTHRILTATRPFRIKTASLNLLFETEHPTRGSVSISPVVVEEEEEETKTQQQQQQQKQKEQQQGSSHILDVRALSADQTVEFSGSEQGEGGDICLDLRHADDGIVRVRLRWL